MIIMSLSQIVTRKTEKTTEARSAKLGRESSARNGTLILLTGLSMITINAAFYSLGTSKLWLVFFILKPCPGFILHVHSEGRLTEKIKPVPKLYCTVLNVEEKKILRIRG